MYGLTTTKDYKRDGPRMPALKPTMWMSNSPIMLHELTRRCDRQRDHQHLLAGRATDAENYPLDLVLAIIRGMAKTTQAKEIAKQTGVEHWENILSMTTTTSTDVPHTKETVDVPHSTLSCDDGQKINIDYDDANFKTIYRDEYTWGDHPLLDRKEGYGRRIVICQQYCLASG